MPATEAEREEAERVRRRQRTLAASASSHSHANSNPGSSSGTSTSGTSTSNQSSGTSGSNSTRTSHGSGTGSVRSNSQSAEFDGEEEEDLQTALRKMGGQVVETIGEGHMTVWVVRFPSVDRFLQAERRLVNDTRVKSMQRDFLSKSKAAPVDDPYFPSQWYMDALNVIPAWNLSKGAGNVMGILDSGSDISIDDLKSKSLSGFDAIDNKMSQSDVEGHGTQVATTACAIANNGTGTAGPATLTKVYPVRVAFSDGFVSVSAILRAIDHCGNANIKVINLSSNGDPPFSFAHKKFNRVLHTYMEWYHDVKGGLLFNSAGNSGTKDSSRMQPYMIVVSAIDQSYSLAKFSTWGRPVWFTAPGTNIVCSNRGGNVVTVSGTSFSSPLCASIAALIWGAKPSMTNLQVERVMIETSKKTKRRDWNQWFGYGLPDAEAAMRKVLGL